MTSARDRAAPVALCCAAIVVTGYELVAYGSVVPELLDGRAGWALSPAAAGLVGSVALFGMLVGAVLVAVVTDLVGRRRIMLGSVAWLSGAMAFEALAQSPVTFGAARFAAGLAAGGLVPTAIALTIEYAHPRYRSVTNAVMFSGMAMGGVLAAVLARWVLPEWGWRALVAIGASLGLAWLPAAWLRLPESATYLLGRDRPRSDGPSGLRLLLGQRFTRATLLFWLATAVGLFLVYGLNTWLAQLMQAAGYDLGSALTFLIVLNAGAVLGTPLLGWIADRTSAKRTIVAMFVADAACLATISHRLPTPALLLAVALAGAFTMGTAIILNAYTAVHYPAHAQATGLAWALGVGRIGAVLGPTCAALVLDSGWGLPATFYAFAGLALLGAAVVAAVPEGRTTDMSLY